MLESKIVKLNLQRRSAYSEENKSIFEDFNSRVFFPHNKISMLKQLQGHKKKSFIQNVKNLTICDHNNFSNTQSVKVKLQRILKNEEKRIHSPFKQHSQEEKQKRTKSLFFNNIKLNKNKRELEDLSKRSMIEIIKRQQNEAKKNGSKEQFPFLIKQIKLTSDKINTSNPKIHRNQFRNKYQDSYKSTLNQQQFYSQYKSSFPFKKQLTSPKKSQKVRVIQIFQRYDDNWYQRSKQKQGNNESKLTSGSFRTKPQTKLSLKIKNRQQNYQPWQYKPDHIDNQVQQF